MEHFTIPREEPYVHVGIDEAGRGCAVGCLFIAAVALRPEDLEILREMGVTDSKKLTRRRREELEELIKAKALTIRVETIDPSTIDARNLNQVELEAMERVLAKIVNEVKAKGFKVVRVVIDLFGREEQLREMVEVLCPEAEAILEHDADANFTECSAASIMAKVARDRHIDELKQRYGDFGSGYPSDSKTRSWIRAYYEEHGSLPSCVRRTWKTVKQNAPQAYLEKRRRAKASRRRILMFNEKEEDQVG